VTHKVELLEKEKWQGHEVVFSDFADSCYAIEIKTENNAFSVKLTKQSLEKRKIIKYPQTLFHSSGKDVKVFGVIDDGQLIAGMETSIEGWDNNPRLYISLLWVDEKYRRKGIATELVSIAKSRAIEEGLRAVYLDTWSCNEHAIEFYVSQNFKLIGFDACANSNEDIEKYNVPLKLGYLL